MVARSGRGGSIARNWPCSAKTSWSRETLMPASTVAVRSGALWASTWSTPVMSMARSSDSGVFPRPVRVLPPRGETDRPCSAETDIVSDISCGEVGHATAPGTVPSRAYSVASLPVRVLIDSERRDEMACWSRVEFADTGSLLIRRRWPPSWRSRTRDGSCREKRPWGISCRG